MYNEGHIQETSICSPFQINNKPKQLKTSQCDTKHGRSIYQQTCLAVHLRYNDKFNNLNACFAIMLGLVHASQFANSVQKRLFWASRLWWFNLRVWASDNTSFTTRRKGMLLCSGGMLPAGRLCQSTTQVLPITVCIYCHHDGVECQYHRPHRSTICKTFCYCDTCFLATAKCSTFAPHSHNLHAHACIHQYYSLNFPGLSIDNLHSIV